MDQHVPQTADTPPRYIRVGLAQLRREPFARFTNNLQSPNDGVLKLGCREVCTLATAAVLFDEAIASRMWSR
jgi:hypothetical protein